MTNLTKEKCKHINTHVETRDDVSRWHEEYMFNSYSVVVCDDCGEELETL